MGSQHLQLNASGHLRLHSSGHLKLYRTFSFTEVGDYYSTYTATRNGNYAPAPDYRPSQADFSILWDAMAVGLFAAGLSSTSEGAHLRAYAEETGWVGDYVNLRAKGFSHGTVYRLVPSEGSFEGSAVIPSLAITRATTSYPYVTDTNPAGPVLVGTGSSAPTGCPCLWDANVWSGGTTTLTNVEVSEYVWISFGFFSWAAPSVSGDWGRAVMLSGFSASGVIKD